MPRDEIPTPPCERVCNNPDGRCANFLRCSEWREWFSDEWAIACATLGRYTKEETE